MDGSSVVRCPLCHGGAKLSTDALKIEAVRVLVRVGTRARVARETTDSGGPAVDAAEGAPKKDKLDPPRSMNGLLHICPQKVVMQDGVIDGGGPNGVDLLVVLVVANRAVRKEVVVQHLAVIFNA
ncbi:hypothetical protein PF001_g6888 [Phytophthora fragariae]|uniref:Uncharacterized protein n=1 Tax=Phytophthora fragariae TaxID=53985 RepID=A0A6A4E5P5_9STRA|nr:hypothetical protein PF001_g6888 [Phytophthora fragariae]